MAMPNRTGDPGQASVAFIATIPALIGAAVILAQVAVVGYTAWAAAGSARAVARAELVGTDRRDAARAALPAALRDRVSVEESFAGRASVAVGVPRLLPFLPSLSLSASAGLDPDVRDAS
jgi:hypothetical protein